MTTPQGPSQPSPTPPTPTSRSAAPAPILRAIIWHAATGELPGELLSSLSKRIGRMIVCTDAYSALAEACLIERLRRHDLANGSPAPAGGILVLVQPAHLLNVPEVAEAMGSYAPSIALWSYDRGANPKLRAVVEGEMLTSSHRPAAHLNPPTRPAAAQGRPVVVTRPIGPIAPRPLNGHAPSPAPAPQRPARSPTLLTEDELAMLLTPDPQPPTSPIARIPRAPGGGNGTSGKGGRPA